MTDDAITADMQAANNIAWFGLDVTGRIGAFESSGFGWIHPHVLKSESNRKLLMKYFSNSKANSSVKLHREAFDSLFVEDDRDAYCESASFFALRGLFVYDIPLSPRRTSEFVLLVEPTQPKSFSDLPDPIQKIIAPVKLSVDFATSTRFRVD